MLYGRAKRVAREDDLILWEESIHIGVGDTDAVSSTSEELIRHSSIRVLLLNEGRDAKTLGSLEGRSTSIAPDTDDDLRLKLT